jgi:hypothetical protein
MNSCSFRAPNGENSLLFAALEQALGTNKAAIVWTQVQTPEFKDKYDNIPVDINGDPTFEFVFTALNLGQQISEEQTPPPQSTKEISLDTILGSGKARTELRIIENIKALYANASKNPEIIYNFSLPESSSNTILMGDKSKMTIQKLALLLNSIPRPLNVKFSDGFEALYQNTSVRFLNNEVYLDQHVYDPTPISPEKLQAQLEENFVAIRDAEGNKTGGLFDPERQSEVIKSAVFGFAKIRQATKNAGPFNAAQYGQMVKNNVFQALRDIYHNIATGKMEAKGLYEGITVEKAENLVREYDMVLNSFDTKDGLSFWKLTVRQLAAQGMKIKDNKFTERAPDTVVIDETVPGDSAGFQEDAGLGLKDWSDSSFEYDPKDSASARMKEFFATVIDSKVSQEEPRYVDFSFKSGDTRDKIIKLRKSAAVRTAQQARDLKLKEPGDNAVFYISSGQGGEKVPFRATVSRGITQEDLDNTDFVNRIKEEEGIDIAIGDVLFYLEPFVPKDNVVTPNRNYLNLPKLVNGDQVYEEVMGVLAGKERSYKNYIDILRQEGNKYNPNLRALADKLELPSTPQEIRN